MDFKMSKLVEPLPKPIKRERVHKRMRKIGPVGKRRLAANKARKPLAELITWCEIGPLLKHRGITMMPCAGPLTWAHSVKTSRRGSDPVLEDEVARCCETHHYVYLDLLPPEQTAEIVRLAIELRNKR